jgi:hypothetical protein
LSSHRFDITLSLCSYLSLLRAGTSPYAGFLQPCAGSDAGLFKPGPCPDPCFLKTSPSSDAGLLNSKLAGEPRLFKGSPLPTECDPLT